MFLLLNTNLNQISTFITRLGRLDTISTPISYGAFTAIIMAISSGGTLS